MPDGSDRNPTYGALVPRPTIEELVSRRNQALVLFERAHDALTATAEAMRAAAKMAYPSATNSYNLVQEAERRNFIAHIDVPDRAKYLATAKRLTDTDVWAHIIEITGLESLMDTTAKRQLRAQLGTDPPEVTVDNVIATLQTFAADADMIFRRGIATCFSSLDRRFRSHDGWKIGSRIIISHALNDSGHWNYRGCDQIIDVERAMRVLDDDKGQPMSLIHRIDLDRGAGWGRRQGVSETEYFRCYTYMNGNAHLWFKRDDLLEKVNKILGEYYDTPIPEERSPTAETGFDNPKRAVAKNYGFYPSPPAVAKVVIEEAALYRAWPDKSEAPLTVLEPSAGEGALARLAVENGCFVDCIEFEVSRAKLLDETGLYRHVQFADFLAVEPTAGRQYDRVVMNPPFDLERDIDHVLHALKFLKPGGILVSVMSAGTEFRQTKKSVAFRALVEKMGGRFHDLPPASFAASGTYCNTVTLKLTVRP
jgi:hypothetical protein